MPASFNMYLVINKCVTAVKVSNFSGHCLRNRSTLDRGVLGYIGIVWPKEHSPEVWHIRPGTSCIYIYSDWLRIWFKTQQGAVILLFASTYVPTAMILQPRIKYICTLYAGGSEGGPVEADISFSSSANFTLMKRVPNFPHSALQCVS